MGEETGEDRGAGSLVLTLDHSTGAVSYAVCGSLELEEIEAVLNVFRTQSLEPALKAKREKEAEEQVRAREAEIASLLRDRHGIELTDILCSGNHRQIDQEVETRPWRATT